MGGENFRARREGGRERERGKRRVEEAEKGQERVEEGGGGVGAFPPATLDSDP